jgi:ParB-like nuclease domain
VAPTVATLESHPLANLFPLLEGSEFDELVADIKANGLVEPIVVFEDKILDGRNRYRACLAAGVEPAFCPFMGDDPFAYVISLNLRRRHLTAEQKREIVAALLKANPERSNNATAKIAKVDDKTVGAVRAELERRSEIPNVSTRTDSKGRKQPARKTTTKPSQVSEEALQQRDAAAERIRALMGFNKVRDDIRPASNDETARKEAEGEGEGSELGNLLRAWDRASQGAREKFKARVGLVAVEPPAKAMDDGLDIPACLRRGAVS